MISEKLSFQWNSTRKNKVTHNWVGTISIGMVMTYLNERLPTAEKQLDIKLKKRVFFRHCCVKSPSLDDMGTDDSENPTRVFFGGWRQRKLFHFRLIKVMW